MNIILVSGRLAKARTITVGLPQVALLGVGLLLSVVLAAAAMNYLLLRLASDFPVPYLQTMLLSAQQAQHEKTQSYLRENLNAMAVKLGQMQAQLVRLDTLGERLARLAGFKPQDLAFNEPPGRGGAISSLPSQDLSLGDFTRQLDLLTRQLDDRRGKANGKCIMTVLALEAPVGSELVLRASGSDELEALEAIITLIANRFGEPD